MAIKFVDAVGRILPKARMRNLCEAVGLTEEEATFTILRSSERKDTEQVNSAGVTHSQQRTLIPIVNDKVYLWVTQNQYEFFTKKELEKLDKVFQKFNAYPDDEEQK